MTLFFLCLFAVAGYLVWTKKIKTTVPKQKNNFASKHPTKAEFQNAPDITDGDGNFTLEVVGEYYNEGTSKVLQNRDEKIYFAKFLLRPEKTNPHDKNAVAVFFGPDIVGHLSRSDAIEYRKKYNKEPSKVLGLIQGGDIKNSIWLDADFGSGQNKENVFNKASALQSFPVLAEKTGQYAANLSRVLNGTSARILDVDLRWDSKRKNIIVYVENLPLAEIPPKKALPFENASLPAKTIGMITSSSSRWSVKLSNKYRSIDE